MASKLISSPPSSLFIPLPQILSFAAINQVNLYFDTEKIDYDHFTGQKTSLAAQKKAVLGWHQLCWHNFRRDKRHIYIYIYI